jgi:hypothetical protein
VIVLLVVLAMVVAAAVLLAASDQAIARRAEERAAEYLAVPLRGPAAVRVHREPFLTQAFRGRYEDVEVTGTDLVIGEITGAALTARLRNAYLPLRALVGRRVSELPCEHVSGNLVVPWGELARLAQIPTLALVHDGVRLQASLSVPIPGISSLARVSGEALPSVGEDGSVWLRMRAVAVAGIVVPSLVLNQLLPTLRFLIPLPPLPYGLRIDALDPTPAGLVVHGSADAVVFRKQPAPRPMS